MGLQSVRTGYKGLAGNYRRLQRITTVTRGYKGLQGLEQVTRCYMGLQGAESGSQG